MVTTWKIKAKINLPSELSSSSFLWGKKTLTWIQIMTSFSSSSEGNQSRTAATTTSCELWIWKILFFPHHDVVICCFSSNLTWIWEWKSTRYFQNHTSIFTFQIIIISHMTCFTSFLVPIVLHVSFLLCYFESRRFCNLYTAVRVRVCWFNSPSSIWWW